MRLIQVSQLFLGIAHAAQGPRGKIRIGTSHGLVSHFPGALEFDERGLPFAARLEEFSVFVGKMGIFRSHPGCRAQVRFGQIAAAHVDQRIPAPEVRIAQRIVDRRVARSGRGRDFRIDAQARTRITRQPTVGGRDHPVEIGNRLLVLALAQHGKALLQVGLEVGRGKRCHHQRRRSGPVQPFHETRFLGPGAG
ncbi:hypothetical protein [Novosphingobium sp. MBES04]|uniref:hypothetical protein n=1 Tax=Novosphingobium sp. MBES04 TaxID=1206458 RepID=UPI00057EF704|nr:hypothetical protein [Novosphingobium sp. MBES04]GAM07336.1 hypothetical protein MBENS4_4332 [Novosphingobium sp. MBES04]